MTNSREQISKIVINCVQQFASESEIKIDLSEGENTRLFGGDAPLDSLGLVSLIVEIEESLENEIGISFVLADEKAMSRRTSPFSRIAYLVDYIDEILKKQKNEE
jgi:D-alanine--poly(phosphoribitol) ligase subunit 2